MLQGRRKGWKSGGCQYYLVGLICLPPVEIGLTDLQKSGHLRHPRRRLAENGFWYLILLCEPCPNWKSIMDLIDRQGKNNWNDYDCDRKNKIQCPSFSLSATGLFWCGRLWYWTILRWEILLLDFFAVGDCGTGLFWSGRFCYWTFLKWEILMLDFLASGQMNCTAYLRTWAKFKISFYVYGQIITAYFCNLK